MALLALCTLAGCADEWDEMNACTHDGDCFFSDAEWEVIRSLSNYDCKTPYPIDDVPWEKSNELTGIEDNSLRESAVALGKALFNDAALSSVEGRSCATCHNPKDWFASDDAQADDVRNITSVVNVGYYDFHLWHGAKPTLWEQAMVPLILPTLMNGSLERILTYIAEQDGEELDSFAEQGRETEPDYRGGFEALFPDTVDWDAFDCDTHDTCVNPDPPTNQPERLQTAWEQVGQVLAAYMYTVTSGPTPFDRYASQCGENREWVDELDDAAKRGLRTFIRQNCVLCHKGPAFTDNDFHNIGDVGRDPERDPAKRRPEDGNAFRTPSLRNVEKTGPYMHTGNFEDLLDVIWHYNAEDLESPDPKIWRLELTSAEEDDLVAFLRTLTEDTCAWNDGLGCP